MNQNDGSSPAKDANLDARARLSIFGPRDLSDLQLLSIVLGKNIAKTAKLLEHAGGLFSMSQKTQKELEAIPGLGPCGAQKICAMVEMSRRLLTLETSFTQPLRQPSDASSFARAHLLGQTQECFLVLGLDSRQRVKLVRTVGMGSLAQVDVHPREVFRPLIREGIHAVILVHNHPSGDPQPSEADVELTHRLAKVGKLVGIPVLDHLVVTDHDFCSLAALGLLLPP